MESFEGDLVLVLEADAADPESSHAAAHSLAMDLRLLDIAQVRFANEEIALPVADNGAEFIAKSGTGNSIATLVLTGVFSAAALKAMADVVVAAIKRSGARSVTVQRGQDKVVLTALSGAEMHKLVETLLDTSAHGGGARLDHE